nr:dehydrogenase [Shinella kummerowiae]
MRPHTRHEEPIQDGNPIDQALAWHDGDPRATIATLLADCGHLRRQLALAKGAMSTGFARGWRPSLERE